jgi:hypothetical protein
MTPRCQYHPAVEMRRVEGPRLKQYGNPKKSTHKYYRCSVAACPFVMVIEKKQPLIKPKRVRYAKRYVDDWNVERSYFGRRK